MAISPAGALLPPAIHCLMRMKGDSLRLISGSCTRIENEGKNRFRFIIEILIETFSPANTFSGNCSDRAICFSALRETIPETTIEESSAARIMNMRLLPVPVAVMESKKTKPRYTAPAWVTRNEKGNSPSLKTDLGRCRGARTAESERDFDIPKYFSKNYLCFLAAPVG